MRGSRTWILWNVEGRRGAGVGVGGSVWGEHNHTMGEGEPSMLEPDGKQVGKRVSRLWSAPVLSAVVEQRGG